MKLESGRFFSAPEVDHKRKVVVLGDTPYQALFATGGLDPVNKKVRMENTGYFRPPDDAHEDPEAMLPWARLALEAALRARAAKAMRPGKKRAPARGKAAPAKAPARPSRRKTR